MSSDFFLNKVLVIYFTGNLPINCFENKHIFPTLGVVFESAGMSLAWFEKN